MLLIHKIYRFLTKVQKRVRVALIRYHLKLLGQIELDPETVVEPEAIIELTAPLSSEKILSIGAGTKIKNGAFLAPRTGYIKIGINCSINRNCVLLGYGGITIGNNERIAANSSIVAFNHNFENPELPIISQGNRAKGITIDDDVWIGTGVRILDGVNIGKGCVIGAGAVVTKSLPPLQIAVGNPARIIRERGQ